MKAMVYTAALCTLAACAAMPAEQGKTAAAEQTVPAAETLSGNWRITRLGEENLPADTRARLSFDAAKNSFGGNAGCNNLFGGYTAANGSLKFGGVASTRMACFAPIMTREKIMIEALNRTAAYGFDNGALVLLDAQNKPLLKAVRSAGM